MTRLVGAGIDLALAQLAPLVGDGARRRRARGGARRAQRRARRLPGRDRQPARDRDAAAPRRPSARARARRRCARALPSAGRQAARPGPRLVPERSPVAAATATITAPRSRATSATRRSTSTTTAACTSRPTGARSPRCSKTLVAEWPAPLDELVLLGHSMGGLVARSACHSAEANGHAWRREAAHARLPRLAASRRAARARRQLGRRAARREPLQRAARAPRTRSAAPASPTCASATCSTSTGTAATASPTAAMRAPALALPDGVACYAIAGTTAPQATRQAPRRRSGLRRQRARPSRQARADARLPRVAPVDRVRHRTPRPARSTRGVRPAAAVALRLTRRCCVYRRLPYANGPLHLGHLAGAQVPADVHARWLGTLIGRQPALPPAPTSSASSATAAPPAPTASTSRSSRPLTRRPLTTRLTRAAADASMPA